METENYVSYFVYFSDLKTIYSYFITIILISMDSLPSLSVHTAIKVRLLLYSFVRCWYFNDYSSLGLSFYKFFQGFKQSHYIETMWFELAIKERERERKKRRRTMKERERGRVVRRVKNNDKQCYSSS